MTRTLAAGGIFVSLLAFLAATGAAPAAALGQQAGADEAALAMLNSARRALNEGNYAFAAERFREFIRTYADRRETVSARYGLALALIELPEKDYKAAAEALQQVIDRGDFPDRPLALYHMGAAQRGLGACVGGGQVQSDVVGRLALPQQVADALQVAGDVGHHDPPR
ncbi:MAG: hypothetical protein NTX87_00885, partial [Planctomycetota bacterium]|nr:hypothetical protein [Planctomycetota bacterium]